MPRPSDDDIDRLVEMAEGHTCACGKRSQAKPLTAHRETARRRQGLCLGRFEMLTLCDLECGVCQHVETFKAILPESENRSCHISTQTQSSPSEKP